MDGYRVWVADGGKMAYGGPVQLGADIKHSLNHRIGKRGRG